jgi:hypothetical protein
MTQSIYSPNKKSKMEWIYLIAGLIIVLLFTGLLSSCTVVKTNYSTDAKKSATVYYYLPESILKIKTTVKVAVYYNLDDSKLNGSCKVVEQSFVATTQMIADTKNLLSLNYKPNALMADDIKYGVNSMGLLETVNITTEDRTADIISKLTEAPKVILSLSGGAPKTPNIIAKIKEYTADFELKASFVSSEPYIISWPIIITNELGKDDFITVPADFQISSKDISAISPSLIKLITGDENSKTIETEGIITRPLKNVELNIKSAYEGFNPSLPTNVVIADNSKLIIIPINRTAFVKRVNKIGIQNGIIISNEINKPSSVEGFISIPINIAKAIISIPAQLVQFRFDNTKSLDTLEKAKLSYEKSILDSQKFSLTKEQEIEKLKLEMQKSLLEAGTNKLKVQKDLDALKKEVEELKKNK